MSDGPTPFKTKALEIEVTMGEHARKWMRNETEITRYFACSEMDGVWWSHGFFNKRPK